MKGTDNKGIKQSEQRKSCVFYRSFFEAIEGLPEVNQLNLYRAIFNYSLNFQDPELSGLEVLAWTLIKPQLDANMKKYLDGCKGASHGIKGKEHGKKGGRKRKENNNPPLYPPINGAEIPPQNRANDNVNDNDNALVGNQRFLKDLKENEYEHASWAEGLHMQLGLKLGKLPELLKRFCGHLQSSDKEHEDIESFKHHFRNWLFTEDKMKRLDEFKHSKIGMI
ncbi:MAG: DUF6291 domain-containing protein [Allomuricauda sp.]